ncbi:MAG: T9SS type A sorting domain-containing protein [Ginsengibacter sp.]
MKFTFLPIIIFATFSINSFSQSGTFFAITGQGKGDFNWSDIRSFDMISGNVNSVLFQNGKTNFSFLNAESNLPADKTTINIAPLVSKKLTGSISASGVFAVNPSTSLMMSAAIAYDQKHEKLFFATMKSNQLVWLDMKSSNNEPAFYTIDQPLVENAPAGDEAFIISRMTIGANGNGYALTNDANHLISFTTGNKTVITDLGNIVDADTNKGISIHNQCTSWGGDMVADAFGKLFLFSAAHQVFVIDVDTRIATNIGSVLKLPGTFSLNGAAADNDGNVIVSSANTFDGFYKINMTNLSATKLPTTSQFFNASDLASSYLLNQNEATMEKATVPQVDIIGNRFITIYPNPVSDGQVKISFDKPIAGEYKIELNDLQGRVIEYQTVYIKSPGQLENFKFHNKPAGGLYIIKVTDIDSKIIFSDKLIIE